MTRDDVTELGAVLTGSAEGRTSPDEITLFDSTGLAIQDLALCHAVLEAARTSGLKPPTARPLAVPDDFAVLLADLVAAVGEDRVPAQAAVDLVDAPVA